MNATEIRSTVEQILADAKITYSVRLVGETVRDEKWKCDAWRFTFSAGAKRYDGDYFTGLGNRKPVNGAPSDKGNPNTLFREEWEKRWLKPVAPNAADVLHSLTLDATAADECFADWCANYGYSDDSLKALNTYRQCCAIAKELRAIFPRDVLDAIRKAVEEL